MSENCACHKTYVSSFLDRKGLPNSELELSTKKKNDLHGWEMSVDLWTTN